ncbi:MAG: glutamate synthase large subunit [Maricaulaceae bacterium]
MTAWRKQRSARARLIAAGAYDPAHEHDACGVGLLARLDNTPDRDVVAKALSALKAVWHRGAVGGDGATADGAGIMLAAPDAFFRDAVERTGHTPGEGPICVGQVFLPRTDLNAQEAARTVVEAEVLKAGFYLFGWRQVPTNVGVLGDKAADARPEIEQIMFADPDLGADAARDGLERRLYLLRRRIEARARRAGLPEFYLCSLSSRAIIYKGMVRAEVLDEFYPDLKDPRMISTFAIYHQRYSTNTFPEWRLAQPFRMLAHNAEINTIKGNINWMKSHEIRMASSAFAGSEDVVRPVVQPGASDSAALDQVFELLVRAGRSGRMTKALLIPEAWSSQKGKMPEPWRALYAYCNAVMEPWDGPAAVCAFDGRYALAGLDRNGLRPLRYAVTRGGLLAVGSETGMCPLNDAEVTQRGAVPAGGLIAADLQTGDILEHAQLLDRLSEAKPFAAWLDNVVDLEPEIGPGSEPRLFEGEALTRRQRAGGVSHELLEVILAPMGETGKEPVGSMGDDAPLAVLSRKHRPLSHYFRQNFSQVTNPPIDPLREGRVMSLRTRFKNLGNILAEDETQTDVFVLDSPVLTNGMYDRLLARLGDSVAVIDCTFDLNPSGPPGAGLAGALEAIRRQALEAVQPDETGVRRVEHLILSDERQSAGRAPIPMVLAVGAVHSHLVAEGARTYCSITARAGDCFDTHDLAVLIGVGATCVNPYIALDSLAERWARGLFEGRSYEAVSLNYKRALEAGLLKILSKMGISVLSSYRGAYNFEALGLSRALVDAYFPGLTSRISGVGLSGVEAVSARLHAEAWGPEGAVLPLGGLYRQREGEEAHALGPGAIHRLQHAVTKEDYPAYKRFSEDLRTGPPVQIRDLLEFRPLGPAVPGDAVEAVNAIRKRFVTPGMSLGALSPEAHETLNIAMNRIGAKSVSGEGGEDPERYETRPNGDNANSAVKQVASGRFGVTAEYLNQAREIEIKVAQGAKPGEGGQLPGFKVTDFIARMRHATPGVTLISPPPHHDIYSIEDLAQLIYDLKQINPDAEVCVKLVAASGVGPIAAGVAKAEADIILIAGHNGGTGASPQSSIKHVGAPWELGLAEAHQILLMNDLRGKVRLRTDGGLRTGRDIVIAAMLGAEEFGIGTLSLVAMGCLMVRQCHANTCPVGVCVQDERLRERFTGTPQKVVNLMTFIAEETREILARLGARSLDEVVGRSDLLHQVSRGAPHLDDLDLNPLLVRADDGHGPRGCVRTARNPVVDGLDAEILRDGAAFFDRMAKLQLSYGVKNTHRAIGARASSKIVRRYGPDAVPEGRLSVRLTGSAGQSLGAFAVKGLRIDLEGDANDYVGKGLSGATLMVRPPDGAAYGGDQFAIIGNTCLYGATSGVLLAAGRAGERFAVRNSGATAVVEGCGSNGCEYMTGGTAVILGSVGENFAAGMTGGLAYVYDRDGRFEDRVNPESVALRRFVNAAAEADCRDLIARHAQETRSPLSARLIDEWALERSRFWQVVPKEMLDRIDPEQGAEPQFEAAG